jgi:hypothetical protein
MMTHPVDPGADQHRSDCAAITAISRLRQRRAALKIGGALVASVPSGIHATLESGSRDIDFLLLRQTPKGAQ